MIILDFWQSIALILGIYFALHGFLGPLDWYYILKLYRRLKQ